MSAEPGARVKIDPKFVIRIGDKPYVMIGGLVDAAHRHGLQSIVTTPICAPTETYQYAAVSAAVTTIDGRTFSGQGEAEPGNVKSGMATSLLRIAETRAISRALARMLNLSDAVYDYEREPPTEKRQQVARTAQPARPGPARASQQPDNRDPYPVRPNR